MQLEQTFTIAAPVDTVWQAFHDTRLLVDCLPGASLDERIAPADPQDLPLRFQVRLGPISAGFAGQGRVALDEAGRHGSFSGQAVDARSNSRVRGEARFEVADDGAGGTRVALVVDHTITGSLAQFSREGIVRALADQLTRQFAQNLQERLLPAPAQAGAAGGDAQAAAPAGAGTPPARADASSIDLWAWFRHWLAGLFARGQRR